MNQTENFELEEKLYSKEKWIEDLYPCVTEKYVKHGFTCPKDFMGIRIFDFLNLVGNDRYVAAELLEELSNYLYPDVNYKMKMYIFYQIIMYNFYHQVASPSPYKRF